MLAFQVQFFVLTYECLSVVLFSGSQFCFIYKPFLWHLVALVVFWCAIDGLWSWRAWNLSFNIPVDHQTLVTSHTLGHVFIHPVDLCSSVIVTKERLCNWLKKPFKVTFQLQLTKVWTKIQLINFLLVSEKTELGFSTVNACLEWENLLQWIYGEYFGVFSAQEIKLCFLCFFQVSDFEKFCPEWLVAFAFVPSSHSATLYTHIRIHA